MASIKLIHATWKVLKDGTSPVLIRIIHNKKPKYLTTGFNCFDAEWDKIILTITIKKTENLIMLNFAISKMSYVIN